MKTLIIYYSKKENNTKIVAHNISRILKAEIITVERVRVYELHKYDLIGFGSWISFGKHAKELLRFVEKLPSLHKRVFVFSTSKNGQSAGHLALKEGLKNIDCEIIGEFSCKGEWRLGIGPIGFVFNRGHPKGEELMRAQGFARSLMEPLKGELT